MANKYLFNELQTELSFVESRSKNDEPSIKLYHYVQKKIQCLDLKRYDVMGTLRYLIITWKSALNHLVDVKSLTYTKDHVMEESYRFLRAQYDILLIFLKQQIVDLLESAEKPTKSIAATSTTTKHLEQDEDKEEVCTKKQPAVVPIPQHLKSLAQQAKEKMEKEYADQQMTLPSPKVNKRVREEVVEQPPLPQQPQQPPKPSKKVKEMRSGPNEMRIFSSLEEIGAQVAEPPAPYLYTENETEEVPDESYMDEEEERYIKENVRMVTQLEKQERQEQQASVPVVATAKAAPVKTLDILCPFLCPYRANGAPYIKYVGEEGASLPLEVAYVFRACPKKGAFIHTVYASNVDPNADLAIIAKGRLVKGTKIIHEAKGHVLYSPNGLLSHYDGTEDPITANGGANFGDFVDTVPDIIL
jgi:hypothetical protein